MDISLSSINSQSISDLSSTQKSNIETDEFKQALDNAVQNGDDKELKKACVEFESYFLNMMFKSMRSTVISNDGIFAKSNAEKIFQDMLDEQMTKDMASAGGVGLADMMYKQLSKQNATVDFKG